MLKIPIKKVDGLFRREKAPDFGMERGEGIDLEKEFKPERAEEIKEIKLEEQVSGLPPETVAAPPVMPAPPIIKSPTQQQVENILADDLEKIYADLPRVIQEEFKVKGEITAFKITLLLQKAKVKIREVIKLIREWLKTIPGINKFFLEQEAKIKADKIIDLRRPK